MHRDIYHPCAETMTTPVQKGLRLFEKRIGLLIVDDHEILRVSLADIFSSPLFDVTTAATVNQACDVIDQRPVPWHCWVVDIDLGRGQSGLDLLTRYPNFQFAIVLSGLQRMSLAAEAIRLGARMAIDKDPSSVDRLHDAVCKTAALGFLFNGKKCDHIDLFQLLQDDEITTIEEWARCGCIELRKLHRICDCYPPITPKLGLALYRAVYYLLRNPVGAMNERFSIESRANYEAWIDYTVRKYGYS